MRRGLWVWTRLTGGAAILTVLVWQLGTGPFLEGLRRVDAWSLVLAAGIAVPTTVCCAWRWRLVSQGLGTDLGMREAVGAYYRSQFLNTVLPGGVLGDVHRAVSRGRDVGDVGHGLRAVVWERSAGQVVQVAVTVLVLVLVASPVRPAMPAVAAALATSTLCVVLLGRAWPGRRPAGPLTRLARAAAADVRNGVLAPGLWPGVVAASALVVVGHTATFLLAAHTAGTVASPRQLVPLALLVLLAMALPTNVAGWGPREGAAAWAFAAAGLGAAQGVATAVVYGVMALVATLPGAALLVVGRSRGPASAARERATRPHEGVAGA